MKTRRVLVPAPSPQQQQIRSDDPVATGGSRVEVSVDPAALRAGLSRLGFDATAPFLNPPSREAVSILSTMVDSTLDARVQRLEGRIALVIKKSITDGWDCMEVMKESVEIVQDPSFFGVPAARQKAALNATMDAAERYFEDGPRQLQFAKDYLDKESAEDGIVPLGKAIDDHMVRNVRFVAVMEGVGRAIAMVDPLVRPALLERFETMSTLPSKLEGLLRACVDLYASNARQSLDARLKRFGEFSTLGAQIQ